MAEITPKPVWLEPDNLELLGFEVTEDKNNGYLKLQNNGKILWNPDYNRNFPESRGKVLISLNYGDTGEYGKVYMGIKQDGGTRTVYNGLCNDEEMFIILLKNIR